MLGITTKARSCKLDVVKSPWVKYIDILAYRFEHFIFVGRDLLKMYQMLILSDSLKKYALGEFTASYFISEGYM